MFEGFETLDVKTKGVRIHGRHGGNGPPMLLLHGNPMTHVTWHKLVPELSQHFHVVATDLRGYGDSLAPPPGDNNINSSFRAMADDQVQVMRWLGFERFYVAGHDRGDGQRGPRAGVQPGCRADHRHRGRPGARRAGRAGAGGDHGEEPATRQRDAR